jgi:uncharacterized protein (DUF1501 family)
MKHPNQSRRNFLGSMLAMAGTASTPFALNLAAMATASAEGATDYKAIVCLFMSGGNDQANTLLATDPESWNSYTSIRNTGTPTSIALPRNSLLSIDPATIQSGRSFALHPQLGAVKNLFDSGRAAIVTNVGTLIQPTTLAQYKAGSVPLPPKLFSHNDQQSVWQSSKPEGAAFGWGGRMGDLLASSNSNTSFTTISLAGNAVFLTGRQVRQYQVGGNGPEAIQPLTGSIFGVPTAANPLRAIITADRTDPMEKEHVSVINRAINLQAAMGGAMVPAGAGGVPNPSNYINPNNGVAAPNPLALQLQTVARIIAGRSALGAKRQVFYVNIGTFDTHDNQRIVQDDLLAQLAHAISYFDTILATLQGTDMRSQVTTFTASDFGRTFTSNGDGTDHGWGSHHFVFGGAVKGGDIYGTMPVTSVGHALDVGSGSLLPSISVDQYGATLGSWFGLSVTQIADVFPNIVNFNTANLGFMNPA